MKLMNFTKRAAQAGFTMIELLVVIAILGVLAVVVLGAINPLEQINRGRDTSSKADAEAIISAVERYNANIGRFPWMANDTSTQAVPTFTQVTDTAPVNITGCTILEILGQGDTSVTGCNGTQEIKAAMVERVGNEVPARGHYLYYQAASTGDSVYVCFSPQSNAFRQQADEQCDLWLGRNGQTAAPPADIVAGELARICPATAATANATGVATENGRSMVCLP